MGGTTLHAGILAQWFKNQLLLLFLKIYSTMVVNGILFGVIQPRTIFCSMSPGVTVLVVDMEVTRPGLNYHS